MTGFEFIIIGGPHGGEIENPTCYARTTQRSKHIRWTRSRISEATGKVLPPRLTQWARYQDYVEHVRRAFGVYERDQLIEEIWPILHAKEGKVVVDVVAQFRGRQHSDADHVASTVADALFPRPPTKRPRRRSGATWGYDTLRHSPGDGLVLARMLDFIDGADSAFVVVKIHGPYPRDWWGAGPIPNLTRLRGGA